MLRKYLLVTAFALLGALTLVQSKALADDTVHWAKLNPNTFMGKLSRAMRARVKHIPSIKEVNVPIYPDAEIYMYSPHAGAILLHKNAKRALPVFSLVSKDPAAEIVSFYKTHLKGYKRVDPGAGERPELVLFVKVTGQDAGMANLDLAGMPEKMIYHPHVDIMSGGATLQKAIPGGKSIIHITYRPRY
jgi:hypothetical protein